jgi:hypothetical protein
MNFSYGNYARNYDNVRPRMQLRPQQPPMMTAAQGMSPAGQMSAPLTASPMQGQPGIPPMQPNYGAIARQMTPPMQTAQPNVQLPRQMSRGMAY